MFLLRPLRSHSLSPHPSTAQSLLRVTFLLRNFAKNRVKQNAHRTTKPSRRFKNNPYYTNGDFFSLCFHSVRTTVYDDLLREKGTADLKFTTRNGRRVLVFMRGKEDDVICCWSIYAQKPKSRLSVTIRWQLHNLHTSVCVLEFIVVFSVGNRANRFSTFNRRLYTRVPCRFRKLHARC